jgi:hypothetical protein
MQPGCPHCNKAIDIVGAAELDKEYGIGGNSLQYARDNGKFPKPWLQFGNRNIYLRSDVEAYTASKTQEGTGKALTTVQKYLETLPPEERERVLNELRNGT